MGKRERKGHLALKDGEQVDDDQLQIFRMFSPPLTKWAH